MYEECSFLGHQSWYYEQSGYYEQREVVTIIYTNRQNPCVQQPKIRKLRQNHFQSDSTTHDEINMADCIILLGNNTVSKTTVSRLHLHHLTTVMYDHKYGTIE